VVDVGGGSGALLAIILALFDARRIVFDLPSGLEAFTAVSKPPVSPAEATWSRAISSNPCLRRRGLYAQERHHDWDDECSLAILRSCRTAMPGHAKLLLIDRLMPPRSRPRPPTSGSL